MVMLVRMTILRKMLTMMIMTMVKMITLMTMMIMCISIMTMLMTMITTMKKMISNLLSRSPLATKKGSFTRKFGSSSSSSLESLERYQQVPSSNSPPLSLPSPSCSWSRS